MRGPGTDPLLLGLAAGQERAFAALYDRFGSRLYRAALGMLGRPEALLRFQEQASEVANRIRAPHMRVWCAELLVEHAST